MMMGVVDWLGGVRCWLSMVEKVVLLGGEDDVGMDERLGRVDGVCWVDGAWWVFNGVPVKLRCVVELVVGASGE